MDESFPSICVDNKRLENVVQRQPNDIMVSKQSESIKQLSNASSDLHFEDIFEADTNEFNGDVEVIEENAVGRVVQSNDGEFYIVFDEDHQDIEVEPTNELQILVNEDGNETIILNDLQHQQEVCYEGLESETMKEVDQSALEFENGYDFMELIGDVNEEDIITDRSLVFDASVNNAELETDGNSAKWPQGMKLRRNRVYGLCRCPVCGQSFVNTARLERHLAVHQVFGSYLCALCGKSYKYEYNLFHHWRKTCRDLTRLISSDDRKSMDVHELKSIVDGISAKRAEVKRPQIGINPNMLFGSIQAPKWDKAVGNRGTTCSLCGLVIVSSHIARHKAVHSGEAQVDARSVSGSFFCDLCGLAFRQHSNLLKHWRSSCTGIQANLPENHEMELDDNGLKEMVASFLKRETNEDGTFLTDDFSPKKGGSGPSSHDFDEYATSEYTQQEFYQGMDDESGENDSSFYDESQSNYFTPDPLNNRPRWSNAVGHVQCPECFRSFANQGRLERHLAGYHSSHGSHHCILCGNRFKYDYNLLFHYRRSCPYTKSFIDATIREQVDATNLRRIVRSLAQKDLRLNRSNIRSTQKDQLELNKRRPFSIPVLPPQHIFVTRPDLDGGTSCPVCSIVFYSDTAVEKHLKAAHPTEWDDMQSREREKLLNRVVKTCKEGAVMQGIINEKERIQNGDFIETPPILIPEQSVNEVRPVVKKTHRIVMDEDGHQTIVDENGAPVVPVEGEEFHVQIDGRVEEFMSNGQMKIQLGGEFVVLQSSVIDSQEMGEYIEENEPSATINYIDSSIAEISERKMENSVNSLIRMRNISSNEKYKKSNKANENNRGLINEFNDNEIRNQYFSGYSQSRNYLMRKRKVKRFDNIEQHRLLQDD